MRLEDKMINFGAINLNFINKWKNKVIINLVLIVWYLYLVICNNKMLINKNIVRNK